MTASVEQLPPGVDREVYERQAQTMHSFMALLNEISQLGMVGFGRVIDTATPDDLALLAQSAATIRVQLAKFKAAHPMPLDPPARP